MAQANHGVGASQHPFASHRIFGYFIGESDAVSPQLKEENMVLLLPKKQQITHAVVKRQDVIKGIVKVPHLNFTVTSSQKGVLTIFNNQNNCFIIKPMEKLFCVCLVTSDHLAKDNIQMGDDKGYVHLLAVTTDHFGLKLCKGKKEFVKHKLYDDWVVEVKYISYLNCFRSCSSHSIHSRVLDDIKPLGDNLPVKEFSIPRGLNAFTYCGKAKVVVTGGHDKLLCLHPSINSRPTGKLLGNHGVVKIVTNEKDQHTISLSSARIFRVDIQTLSLLKVFHGNQGSLGEMETFAVVFDNDCGTLTTSSAVIDIYPTTHMIHDTRQEKINVLVYNRAFHQILCSESVLKGDLVKELLPFSKYPSVPLTALCTDISTKMLLVGSKEGHTMHSIASFLEDSQNSKNQIKEELCWRAHSTEVVDLFHEEEKNVVVTASIVVDLFLEEEKNVVGR
ncbi:LOW QUALITY PROTEIN: WD repeat-containing protein 64 [Chlamydotis macqueenii]